MLAALGLPRPKDDAAPRRLPAPPVLEGVFAALHDSLERAPASADELARAVEQPVGEVLAALVELELRGLVTCHGGCYERIESAPRGKAPLGVR